MKKPVIVFLTAMLFLSCGDIFDLLMMMQSPAGVVVLDSDQTSVKVSWDEVEGATSYNIYYSDSPGVTRSSGIKVSGISETSHIVTGLSGFNVYYFIVTAVNFSGESLPSSKVGHTCYRTLAVTGSTYGNITSVSYVSPSHITCDGTNLYVSDDTNGIRQIDIATETVTTIYPYALGGLFTDGISFYGLYNCQIVRVDIATKTMTVIAGTAGGAGYADGPGQSAKFQSVWGVACDGVNIYVSDRENDCVRKVVISTGEVSTLASGMNGPRGMVLFGTKLYVADQVNNCIKAVDITSGAVTTLASVSDPIGITTDGTSLYVLTNTPPPSGIIYKVSMSTGSSNPLVSGLGSYPYTITNDGTYLYVGNTIGCSIIRVQ